MDMIHRLVDINQHLPTFLLAVFIAIGLFFGILQIVRSNADFPVSPISSLAGLVVVMAVIGLGGLFL